MDAEGGAVRVADEDIPPALIARDNVHGVGHKLARRIGILVLWAHALAVAKYIKRNDLVPATMRGIPC